MFALLLVACASWSVLLPSLPKGILGSTGKQYVMVPGWLPLTGHGHALLSALVLLGTFPQVHLC